MTRDGHECPYCGEWVSGDKLVDTWTDHDQSICEVFVCPACDQTFTAEYTFTGYYNSDGEEIYYNGDIEE